MTYKMSNTKTHQQNNNKTYSKTNHIRTSKTKNSTEYKKKIKNSNIIHVKVDKVNGLVLINKNEYINKTLKFIKENNFTKIMKKKPPINTKEKLSS